MGSKTTKNTNGTTNKPKRKKPKREDETNTPNRNELDETIETEIKTTHNLQGREDGRKKRKKNENNSVRSPRVAQGKNIVQHIRTHPRRNYEETKRNTRTATATPKHEASVRTWKLLTRSIEHEHVSNIKKEINKTKNWNKTKTKKEENEWMKMHS